MKLDLKQSRRPTSCFFSNTNNKNLTELGARSICTDMARSKLNMRWIDEKTEGNSTFWLYVETRKAVEGQNNTKSNRMNYSEPQHTYIHT